MRHNESKTQINAVKWFRYQYPQYSKCLCSFPNGSLRSKAQGGLLVAEGMTAGASDLILMLSRNGFGCLCIEFKTKTGVQSEAQKEFQKAMHDNGNKYVICRSIEDFIKEIIEYLM